MELTKELLEKRIKNLMAQKERLIANINATEGAIQMARGLLSDLDREEPTEKDEGADNPAPSEGKLCP